MGYSDDETGPEGDYEYSQENFGSSGWRGGGSGLMRGRERGRRSRGSLTEMVMESEIGGVQGGDAAYRLLEEDGDGDGGSGGDMRGSRGLKESSGRRNV